MCFCFVLFLDFFFHSLFAYPFFWRKERILRKKGDFQHFSFLKKLVTKNLYFIIPCKGYVSYPFFRDTYRIPFFGIRIVSFFSGYVSLLFLQGRDTRKDNNSNNYCAFSIPSWYLLSRAKHFAKKGY